MDNRIAFIGFGEAGQAFATARAAAVAYDSKTDVDATRDAKRADYDRMGVTGRDSAAGALDGAAAVLSLVTADQALAAAESYARHLMPGTYWFDMNSVAPETKRRAAAAILAAGGRYVDVAVMAPVDPQRLAVPMLASGPDAEAGAALLGTLGFASVRAVAGGIGAASSVKMIRSVMVKGIEALSAECVLAADAAGVRDAVIASLDASWPGADWAGRFDYNLDRMMAHGLRRAAEMEEVVETLEALGTGAAMARATVERQRAIGRLRLDAPRGLDAKLAALRSPESPEYVQERAA